MGALSIVFGIILIATWCDPRTVLTFFLVVAIFAIVGGFIQAVLAVARRVKANKKS